MTRVFSQTRGWVYFLRCGDFVKIGFTSHIKQRMKALLTATPYEVDLIGCFAGTFGQELSIQKKFAASRYRNEWFRCTPDLVAYVREHSADLSAESFTKTEVAA